MTFDRALAGVGAMIDGYERELVGFRRDIHAHPELGRAEFRTTVAVRDRLKAAGLDPVVLPQGTGLICDIAADGDRTDVLALRADLDALPVDDAKDVPYRSTSTGIAHACGHDVHTAIVLGAALVLAELAAASDLHRPVRLIFQPAEELIPGGALDVIAAGGLDDVERILGVHCDPKLPVGRIGLKTGPVTAAADRIEVRLSGPGGHTARPHLSADLSHALGTLVTQVPLVLARRTDPRAGLTLVWGRIRAGSAANAIPTEGIAEGTLRCLDPVVWQAIPELLPVIAREIVAPYGVDIDVTVHQGVPVVDNDADSIDLLTRAAAAMLGDDAPTETDQSLGGEDFGWYLTRVPGALARLGVHPPGAVGWGDLHRGSFDVDEASIGIGVRLLTGAALVNGPGSPS